MSSLSKLCSIHIQGSKHSDFLRFIYADQRQPDGKLAGPTVSGPAHADFFSQLAASGAENVPWHATFVKDKGYVKF